MIKKITLILLSAFLSLSVNAQGVYTSKKLPVDTTVVSGKLSNGLTYFIKKHDNPKGRGEFYIVHNVGALQEEDNQNGLAHFLEHLAFNGTKNFRGKAMLDYLNKIGVRFGYNVNAYTSKERTVYNISNVPLERESVLDSVLLMIYDWSGNILCNPDEIEKERGVIREEWRRGDDVRSRMVKQTYALQYKGSKYTERDVIGDTAVINNFKPEALLDFYHKWYRPDLQAVVFVGDFDIKALESKIKSLFSTLPESKVKTPKEKYLIPDFDKPLVGVISDPETKTQAVKVIYRHDSPSIDEMQYYSSLEKSTLYSLVASMIGTKMDISKNMPDPDYSTSASVMSPGSAGKWFLQLTVSPNKKDYKRAFRGIFTDMERIKEYGFNQNDLDLAKATILKRIETNAKRLTNLQSSVFVPIIVDHFTHGYPLLHPADENAAQREVLASISLKQVNDAIKVVLSDDNRIFVLNCPQSDIPSAPSADEIISLSEEVRSYALAPFTSEKVREDFYDFSKLKPGKITASVKNDKYNAIEWTLSNGIKVYYVKNDDTSSNCSLYATSYGGLSKLQADEIPSAKMFRNVSRYSNLGNLTDKETRLFLNKKRASVFFDISLYDETLGGSSSNSEKETMFQMVNLTFGKLGLSKENFMKMMEKQDESFQRGRSEYVVYQDSLQKIKYGSNIASQLTKEDLSTISFEKMTKVYADRYGNPADFKFILTSSESADVLKPLVEKYLGSLKTSKKFEQLSSDLKVKNGKYSLNFGTKTLLTPISKINIMYHGSAEYNVKNFVAASLLKHILSDRYLKSIREEKGGTYYVGVDAYLSTVPEKKLSLSVEFDTDPKMKDELVKIIDLEIEDVIKNGVNNSEFNAALLYLKKSFSDVAQRKSYLSERFQSLVLNGADLRDGVDTVLESIKPEDVKKLLSDLISQGNRMYFVYGTE